MGSWGELFWVDQVCINQADEAEKSHQVNQMRHIYNEAAHVIAWLGTPWPDCGFLFAYLTSVGGVVLMGDFDCSGARVPQGPHLLDTTLGDSGVGGRAEAHHHLRAVAAK
ncbi:hypothetical protein Micbo1qcDRAFT_213934 [Microdochium bolleyi]|uniref:Heterokaryon incompatibility domain-containing protein n=1 Tax=Microdochium bolleyi TaxID=196109 RepID=A0A136IVB3_9PEZI|nr:hypothetical protein Micbo1qcDRAFT_213934 [Microdochium bolleyi]